jgi:hypothetical protein
MDTDEKTDSSDSEEIWLSANSAELSSPAAGQFGVILLITKRFGFDPAHVVDVGVNVGGWTRKAVRFFPDARYTLIEPRDHLKVRVQDLYDRGQSNYLDQCRGSG